MGFPVPCAIGMPKFLVRTAMSILAVKDFCRSLLQIFGLRRQGDNTEGSWRLAQVTDARFYPEFYSLHDSAKTIRKSLPPLLFEQLLEGNLDREDVQCAVCLYDIKRGQEVRELPYCSHLFHKKCIDSWLDQDQETCPICRRCLVSEEAAKKLKRRD